MKFNKKLIKFNDMIYIYTFLKVQFNFFIEFSLILFCINTLQEPNEIKITKNK